MSSEIELKEFHPGEYIFFEEDLDQNFYMIESGEVQIFTKDKDGRRVNLALLGPGDCFGEMALILQTPRTASAQAMKFSKIYIISADTYRNLILELPDWAQGLIKTFSDRIRQLNEKVRQQAAEIRDLKNKKN